MSGVAFCDHPGASVSCAIRHPRHLQNKNAGPEKNPDFFDSIGKKNGLYPKKVIFY